MRKKITFYFVTVCLSFCLALGAVEIVLRNLDYSTGTATGYAHQRWLKKHWRPINELGLRDRLIAPRLHGTLPNVYFLGDSFTAGAGVEFQNTYFYQTRSGLAQKLNFFNLSLSGASTRSEHKTLNQFNTLTGTNAAIVVHQYFFNDIEDYITPPSWRPPAWLTWLSRHLAIADFVLSYQTGKTWGSEYKASLEKAYLTSATLDAHLDDITRLHQAIREQQGKVIFVVFPALYPDELMRDNKPLVGALLQHFQNTCMTGDWSLDVSPIAEALDADMRIVSFLDPHPSARLHELVADQLGHILTSDLGSTAAFANISPCNKAPIIERQPPKVTL